MTNQELVSQLDTYRDGGNRLQERRRPEWTESYGFYRGKVEVNRLVQRQPVMVPLMKTVIRTLLSKFRKMPNLIVEDYGNDKQKDVYKNAFWQECVKTAKLKAKDRVNKKQVMLYGRTFWKLRIEDGRFQAEVLDPMDVLIDATADPADLDGTAMDIIHQHIFTPLKSLQQNSAYDQEAVKRLWANYQTPQGIQQASENQKAAVEKAERLENLGYPDALDPMVGETIVEINEHYVRLWSDEKKRFIFHLVTKVDSEILRKEPLSKVLDPQNRFDGYWDDHTPIVSWADDVERTDTWSDGIADIVRMINKILNAFFSQLVENRTLRNFGMNFWNALANPDWRPTSMDPIPGGWYPLPGKPSEVYQKVDIPDLSESLDEMNFLITMSEQATAATATQKGTSEKSEVTLGEVKMMLTEAQDRIDDMQEPYDESWIEFGEKWSRLIDGLAESLKPVRLFKKGYRGNIFPATVNPADFVSADGYGCSIKSAADQERDQINGVQKILAISAQFPANQEMKKIKDKRLLELGDLNPEEVEAVLQAEQELMKQQGALQAVMQRMGAASGAQPQSAINPQPNGNPIAA